MVSGRLYRANVFDVTRGKVWIRQYREQPPLRELGLVRDIEFVGELASPFHQQLLRWV
jgi:hypothetical protein